MVIKIFDKWQQINPFPNQQILGASKLKEFADYNFEFNENGGKLSEGVGKGEICWLCVFKRIVQQIRKNKGLFGKGLNLSGKNKF